MNKTITLQVNNYLKTLDYTHLEPLSIATLHFEYIKHSMNMRLKTDSSLYTESSMILYLFKFLKNKNIDNLSVFTYAKLQELYSYLSTVSTKQGKPLSKSSQRLVYTFFKSFSKWLNEYHPKDAPPFNIFMKSKFKGNNDNLKTAIFSDSVLVQIKKALKVEVDVYTKAYILIALYYGLRSKDIVSLRDSCLSMSDKDGKYDFHYIDHKQNEEVTIPAIETPVVRAISALMNYTHEYRKISGINSIFLSNKQNNNIRILDPYQSSRLNKFVKDHNITDESGRIIQITSHMFRRTLATNLQSSGAPLEATQTLLNHKTKRTTSKYYIKTKNDDYIKQISNVLEYMQVVASTKDLDVAHSEIDFDISLRLSDGYCTNSEMATDDEYICDTFKKRGNCYGCSKMVTTPDFLPYFKDLVKEKEAELETKSIYGVHVTQQIEFEKDIIIALIDKLELLEVM